MLRSTSDKYPEQRGAVGALLALSFTRVETITTIALRLAASEQGLRYEYKDS